MKLPQEVQKGTKTKQKVFQGEVNSLQLFFKGAY